MLAQFKEERVGTVSIVKTLLTDKVSQEASETCHTLCTRAFVLGRHVIIAHVSNLGRELEDRIFLSHRCGLKAA
jgi:hypothetical protein